MGTLFVQPKNTLPAVTECYAFVSVDAEDNNEGVIAAPMGGALMPLIAFDKARLDQIRPIAIEVGALLGVRVKLIRLSGREVLEDIIPQPPDVGHA